MKTVSLSEIAALVGAEVVGDAGLEISGIRPLDQAGPEHLSFYHNRRYLEAARSSRAGVILVADPAALPGRTLLVCREPYAALAALVTALNPPVRPAPGVHASAVVDPSASIGSRVSVGPCAVVGARAAIGDGSVVGACCVLGDDAAIGAECLLHPGVVIEPGCRVGDRCTLHAGAVIGSDGFGFATVDGVHRKVPQIGIVVIEDDVEIGANVCIDRAALGETRVGRGTKIDNLVQIAHNVQIGEHSLIVSQVGISGSTKLGHHVVMAGQAGAAGHLEIGDKAVVAARGAVMGDVAAGAMVAGSPARPLREHQRAMAGLYRLEELRRRVKAIEEALARLGGER